MAFEAASIATGPLVLLLAAWLTWLGASL